MRIRPRHIPSFRGLLIQIHADLFTVSKFISRDDGEHHLTDFEKIVLTLEDRRFFKHGGFDIPATMREIVKMLTFRKHGGASTIDMQFVRTATGFREKKFSRKLYEMALSSLIQFRYSKLQILRSYLECAYFGSGLTGARAACMEEFEKQLEEIDEQESAELAAMLVYPRPRMPPFSWKRKIEKRARYGLRRMRKFEKEFEKLPSGS